MNKKFKLLAICSTVVTFCFNQATFAQTEQVAMADTMRSNGKIYVVVAVCLTILFGLFAYVFVIDKKISTVEKLNKNI